MLRSIITAIGLTFTGLTQVALAGGQPAPSVWVEDVVVSLGTTSVNVNVSLNATVDQQAAEWEIHYDDTILTADISATCPTPAEMDCSETVPGIIIFASGFFQSGGLPDFSGDIVFDLTSAPLGTHPLVIMNELHLEGGSSIPSAGSMDGSIEIQEAPVPVFDLTHDGGGAGNTIDFGVDNLPGPINSTVMATVENTGNDAKNNLAGNCALTGDAGGIFTIIPDPAPFDLAPTGTQTFELNCSTDAPGVHVGEMTCTHNAASSPDVFVLECEEAPTPTYGTTPAPGNPLAMLNANEGNADPTTDLVIDNVGEAGSTLTGSCGLSGDPQISISGSSAFSDEVGEPSDTVTVACDASAEGVFSSTLSCQADPNTSNPGPHTYDVNCTIGPPDPGTWGSNPPSGSTIDLTPDPVPVDTDLTNAGQLEVFNAGDPGDEDIDYNCTIVGGSPEISQDPDPALGTLVAGGASDIISYSCDTSAVGQFSADVECAWSAPLEGVGQLETYTVTCDVREPFSEVVETPTSGTPQTAQVGPGESHTFSFLFEEVLNEGLDATLDDCSLASGTDFAITSPVSFPQTIPSGGSVPVDVQFTDPGTGDTFTDTLNCTYTDNQDGGEPEQTPVSWPLEVNVTGRNVTFRVTKDFSDDNPAGVEVMLECNTGLPLQQQGTVHDPDASGLGPGEFTHLDFVVVDFEPGTMDCDISEAVPAGYEVSYFADIGEEGVATSVFDDDEGCHYEGLESADFICEISNELLPVTVTVNKEWVDDNPGFELPTVVEITLWCTDPIANGGNQLSGNGFPYSAQQFIDPANPGVFDVFPDWDGSTECFVTEEVDAGVLPDTSDCESIPLAPGVDGECTIVNTRLFAGIPTLSQYGLILMALLMLGVGALAFRRYA